MPQFRSKGHGKNRKVIPITYSSRHRKQSNMSVASNITVKEKSVERAMVKDERKGEFEYLKMAAEAEKEGRSQDAKVFREHAKDEKRHGREDKKIVNSVSKDENKMSEKSFREKYKDSMYNYRMQRLADIDDEIKKPLTKEKLIELREESHEIWEQQNKPAGIFKKEAREVYNHINEKLDNKQYINNNSVSVPKPKPKKEQAFA